MPPFMGEGDHSSSPFFSAADAERSRLLMACCRTLNDRQRWLVTLLYYRGWSQAKVAAEWRVTPAAISRMHGRTLRKLRLALACRRLLSTNDL
jgi:RNA polymerase sigma factor (sigma-70 family)